MTANPNPSAGEFVLVPREPTEAMIAAGAHWIDRAQCGLSESEDAAEYAYIDMVKAAPAPVAAEGGLTEAIRYAEQRAFQTSIGNPETSRHYTALAKAARLAPSAAHGHAAASIELSMLETLVPCDCGCGRQCCAHCGTDLGYIAEAATPTAGKPEAGELAQIAHEMENRYAPATGHGSSADTIMTQAVDVAHMLARWAERIRLAALHPAPASGGEAVAWEWRLRGESGWSEWERITHDVFLRVQLQSPDIECRALFDRPAPAPVVGAWRPIAEIPNTDDLFWFRRGNNIDGPAHYDSAHDPDSYDYFAPCEPPTAALASHKPGADDAR